MKVFFNFLVGVFFLVSLYSCLTLSEEQQEKEVDAKIEFKDWLNKGTGAKPIIKYTIKRVDGFDEKVVLEALIRFKDADGGLLGLNQFNKVIPASQNTIIDEIVPSLDKTGTVKTIEIVDISINNQRYSSVTKTFNL